jgi:hypothetical protein
MILLLTLACTAVYAETTERYILKLELKQSHFSLNINQHIKDSMNKVQFEIPVDKQYYDSVKVGDEILDKFRNGSFYIDSSIGNWKITVIRKRIMRQKVGQ